MDANVEAALREWLPHHQEIRICLIATLDVQSIDSNVAQFSDEFGLPHVDVGATLPKVLQDISGLRRTRETANWCEDRIMAESATPVIISNIDLLFHPKLGTGINDQLDPLALFIRLSRRKPLLVYWPGRCHDSTLSYAVPEHNHYRFWPASDLYVIQDSNR